MPFRVSLLLLPILLLGSAVHAEDPATPMSAAALRFTKALEAGDEETQATLASDPDLDPVDMASTLWVWHVAAHARSSGGRDLLPALRAWARRTAGRPDAAGLDRAIEWHAELGPEQLRDEEARRLTWKEARRAAGPEAAADAFARLFSAPDALPPTLLVAAIFADWGHALDEARRPKEAAARFADAARVAEAIPWPRLAVEAWERSGRANVALSDWRGAAEAMEHAVRAAGALGDEPRALGDLLNLAAARRRQGRIDAALEAATRAEALAERRGAAQYARTAREIRSAACLEIGAWTEAEALLRRLIEEHRTAGEDAEASASRLNLALLLDRTGRLAEALTLTEEEIARLSATKPTTALATALRNSAVIYREMGLLERALALHERARDVYEAIGDRSGVVASLLNVSLLAGALGRTDEARARHREVLEARRAGGDEREIALARLNLAALERRAGRAEEALRVGQEARAGLEAAGLRLPPVLWRELALDQAALGHPAEALGLHARAVAAVGEGGADAASAALVLHDAALAHHLAGLSAEALPWVRQCLELRRDAVHGFDPAEATGLGTLVSDAAGLGVSIAAALQATEALDASSAADEAFRFAEWGRALSLVEALASPEGLRTRILSDDLREEDKRSREEVDRARASLEASLAAGSAEGIWVARARSATAEAKRELVVLRLHRSGGTAAAVAWPEPVDAPGARRLLRAHEALVLYQRSQDGLRAVVLRPSSQTLVELGPVGDLDEQIASWLTLAAVPDGPEETLAARLGARLIDPLLPHLVGATMWIVLPEGAASFLPFDALRTADGKRVVERAAVALAPSATVFATLREGERGRPRGERVLALGDPASGRAGVGRVRSLGFADAVPLPASRDEARAVASGFPEDRRTLLLGEDATAARLRAALEAPGAVFRTVHLACHARIDPEFPRRSGLLLAGDDVLDLDDVHRLRVDADLVVLSGCETGRGKRLGPEGVLGLTRGFFVAGARRVVASSWKVRDAATLDLMRAFYAAVAGGAAPADALARAKRDVLARGGPAAHPSGWAAFVLWGPPD